jgi:RNA polymerase sigma-70 factor (ECF subfamily)
MTSTSETQSQADSPDARREMQWMRQAQGGDRAAYGRLIVACQDRIHNGMLRMVGDSEEARELTQEALTRGLARIDTFRGDSAPFTWLFRIAMNLALTQLRQNQRHRVFSLDQPAAGFGGRLGDDDQAAALVERLAHPRQTPPEEVESRERQAQTLAALGRLDPDYRAVLVLRDIEGLDYQQMAQLLELPLGTVKSRLFRARLALRDELKAYLK